MCCDANPELCQGGVVYHLQLSRIHLNGAGYTLARECRNIGTPLSIVQCG